MSKMSKRKTTLHITREHDGSCLVTIKRSDEDMKKTISEAIKDLLVDASCEHCDFTKLVGFRRA